MPTQNNKLNFKEQNILADIATVPNLVRIFNTSFLPRTIGVREIYSAVKSLADVLVIHKFDPIVCSDGEDKLFVGLQ